MWMFCTFCKREQTRISDEHVIPKWMTELYPFGTWEIRNDLTSHTRKSTRYIHLTSRICEPCNNGWMSELEKAVAPILIPLIHGTRTVLTPEAQQTLKSWVSLRAMVYDLHCEQYTPRPRYFKDEEHYQLATSLNCDPYYEFFLGRYNGSHAGLMREDHFETSFFRVATKQFEGNVTRGYSVTLVFKHLVLQMLCIKSPERLSHISMPRDFSLFCFQFGETFPINSYPPFCFVDKIIDDFVKRWSKYMKVPTSLMPGTP
jgi:hypothetical protein